METNHKIWYYIINKLGRRGAVMIRMKYKGNLPESPYKSCNVISDMPPLVNTYDEVAINAERYIYDLHKDEYLVSVMSNVQHWYYVKIKEGYVFAPSKFIGYVNNTGELYSKYTGNGMDGRETEKVLKQWFKKVEEGSDLEENLMRSLKGFVDFYDKKLNKRACIHILK